MSAWSDMIGRYPIPSSMDGIQDYTLKLQWMAENRAKLQEYAQIFAETLRQRGFTVSVESEEPEGTTAWSTAGWIERHGMRVRWLIQAVYPQYWTPQEMADKYVRDWQRQLEAWQRGEQTDQSRYGEVIVSDAQAAAAASPYGQPAQAPTVSSQTTVQPQQTPPSPDSGTVISVTTMPAGPLTFDEWNWYWQQQTGRAGPAPEDVGFPPERRSEKISRQEWQSYVEQWLAGGTAPPHPIQPPTQKDLYSLMAVLLALFGWQ